MTQPVECPLCHGTCLRRITWTDIEVDDEDEPFAVTVYGYACQECGYEFPVMSLRNPWRVNPSSVPTP